jgi:hypothetical protein
MYIVYLLGDEYHAGDGSETAPGSVGIHNPSSVMESPNSIAEMPTQVIIFLLKWEYLTS